MLCGVKLFIQVRKLIFTSSQMKNDPRSCERNLRNCVRSRKNQDFKGV